jgi:hypothetical protein
MPSVALLVPWGADPMVADNGRVRIVRLLVVVSVALLIGCGSDESTDEPTAPGLCDPPQISKATLSHLKSTGDISCQSAAAVAEAAINCEFELGPCDTEGALADSTFVLDQISWDCSYTYDDLEPPPGQTSRLLSIECWRYTLEEPVVKHGIERVGPPGRVSFEVDDYQVGGGLLGRILE